MRCATIAVWAALLCAVAAAPAWAQPRAERDRGGTPAAVLGEAYRAFEAGDFARAYRLARSIDRKKLINDDYARFVTAQSAYLEGDLEVARAEFEALAGNGGSRFAAVARWRLVDAEWMLGRRQAARARYERLLGGRDRDHSDEGLARYRVAVANAEAGKKELAIRQLRALRIAHPAHPRAEDARQKLLALGGADAAALSASDRIERARSMNEAHLWHEAIEELSRIGDEAPAEIRRLRDYWRGMTYFKMRRRYGDAGRILLGLYKEMGSDAARALFHGARALSRDDQDKEAIVWYLRVVDEYPRSAWAPEAQFLAGWLEFNLGNHRAAVPHLEKARQRYPRSKWATSAKWFLGLSYFFLGEYDRATPLFAELARRGGRLDGGKGHYWMARSLQRGGKTDEANAAYRALVGRFPFSWYALLARSRLAEQSIDIGPFGDAPASAAAAPPIDTEVDEKLARDPLIRAADELIAADLGVEAGYELRRGERAFLKRHGRPAGLAMLMDRYRRAGNYNRPWMMAIVYGGSRALNAPAEGKARVWWEHAYPRAYRQLVEKWRHLGGSPPYYLYSIMRKESGFDPHTLSYADAIGLLQMIPPTTRRVVRELDMEYTDDLLYDPEKNVKTGSWYIGRLLHKFKGQIPFGAGSFNCGPRPVMRWMKLNGDRPADEFVELVSYSQTREYMKKVTETYARYVYLYEGEDYRQPLEVDAAYVDDALTY